jgi:kinesin family member 15
MLSNVKTYLRIKPQSSPNAFTMEKNTVKYNGSSFSFDGIFRGASQQEVFEELSEDLLISCMQGYNCTLFAYGQTGSGKTYTIQGNEHSFGLVQRSLAFLHRGGDLQISLSFVEVYNETMLDLLDPRTSLSIREDPFSGVVVENLTVVECKMYEESIELYQNGIKTRRTAATAMNKESSRSHSIFTIHLKSEKSTMSKTSKLCFVDLAGSERLRDAEIEELKMKETVSINRSLLYLGRVIQKLGSDGEGHVGYRESKLTFLLKDSLGGNCRLVIVGNAMLENVNDSINTMNFLVRSKLIKSQAIANSCVGGSIDELKEELRALDMENQALKARLALLNGRSTEPAIQHRDSKRLKEAMKAVLEQFSSLEDEIKRLAESNFDENRKLILDLNSYYLSLCQGRKENIDFHVAKRRKCDDE